MTEPGSGRLPLDRLTSRRLDWRVSRHARRLSLLALAGLALAVVTKRPEFVAVAAPALVLLGTWRGAKPEVVQVAVQLSAGRVFEGEQVAVDVVVTGLGDNPVEMLLHPSDGIEVVRGHDRAATTPARLSLAVTRWGRYWPGFVEVVSWDRCRLFEAHTFVPVPELDCYPLPAQHRKAVVLGPLASRAGDHPARTPGEGMEFAGVREYVAGDRQRSINWAATTRRGRLQVNTFAAERSEDLVLVVDATSDVGKPGSTTVDHALRGALGVARTYLDARDRVGMVFFGERMRWLAPGMGDRQFFRLLDAIMAGRAGWSSGNDITRLPRVALPPGAAVIAFSPLLDHKFIETLRDLRQRGFSVIVVDVLDAAPKPTRDRLDRLAQRIWRLEREALMFSIREIGITVVAWDGKGELALPVQRRSRQPVGARR
ncbi:MAG TPA: DUF58 domain-containing protein [Acidimicrobiales bacterium]|nr:DUF58 domain-containing protein [Acidimicrobiales bacterium]